MNQKSKSNVVNMICNVVKLWKSLPQDAVDAKSSQEEHRQAHRREVP